MTKRMRTIKELRNIVKNNKEAIQVYTKALRYMRKRGETQSHDYKLSMQTRDGLRKGLARTNAELRRRGEKG